MMLPKNRKIWLVCANMRLTTSRGIPSWENHIVVTETEREVQDWFTTYEDITRDYLCLEDEDDFHDTIRERYRDFGSWDFPYGYHLVKTSTVADLWKSGQIMDGMAEYAPEVHYHFTERLCC